MAEFCRECFKNLISNEEVILGKFEELCEGCGEIKQIVIMIKEKEN